ncbi:MAG: hypothetical protein RLZZ546_2740 [Bacteroidota bacterium]|jgi:hypothetical protein
MRILIYLLIILSSCNKYFQKEIIKMEDNSQIECHINNESDLEIIIKNNYKSRLVFSNPNCYANYQFKLFNTNGEVIRQIKIKPDLDCLRNQELIEAGESKKYLFPYKINKLFEIEKNVKYSLKISYIGSIKNGDGRFTNQVLNSDIDFIIQ